MPVTTTPARALVVEDDRSWQQLLTEILTDEGLAVDLADNVEAGVACMRAAPHRIAVVDLSLAREDHRNQDGFQILDAVQRHDPGCQAVLLTGFATVEMAVQALTLHGALSCLRKETFRRAEFRQVVRTALASAPLPAAPATVVSPQQAALLERPRAEQPSAVGRALVVEDDAGWRSVLTELLEELGLQTDTCRSYGEALGLLRRTSYTLAVIDLTLASSRAPDTNSDGLRLLEITGKAGIPAIVVSGSAWPSDIDAAFKQRGIVGFLEKRDFDREAFLSLANQALVSGSDSALDSLTAREREVLDLLAQGLSNREISAALVISENTVKRHIKAIYAKLEVNNRTAAVARLLG